MRVKLPYQRGAEGTSLAVNIAAEAAGVSPYQMAVLATHLFDAITVVVSKGQHVPIQGFGRFYCWHKLSRNGTGATMAYPAFYAARPWRNLVAAQCPLVSAKNLEYMNLNAQRYARVNSLSTDAAPTTSRPFTAFENTRSTIIAQARRNMAEFRLHRTA